MWKCQLITNASSGRDETRPRVPVIAGSPDLVPMLMDDRGDIGHVRTSAAVCRCSRLTCKVWMPSVLWHRWLGVRKSIRPVKIEWWGVGVVICLERSTDCSHMVHLMPLHPQTPASLASFKSRLVLPVWYRLAQVVMEKTPLNRCSSGRSSRSCKVCSDAR